MTNEQKPIDVSRRAVLTGGAGAIATIALSSFLPTVPALAEVQGSNIEGQLKDSSELIESMKKADALRDALELKKQGGEKITDVELGQLYGHTFEYGDKFRKFENKYGRGQYLFDQRDEADDLKEEFQTKMDAMKKDEGDKVNTERLEEFDKYIDKVTTMMVLNGYDGHITRMFLRGFWCGYYENLCPGTN